MRIIHFLLIGFAFLWTANSSLAQIHSYANESVLNEGSWHKIGLTESGMYRLDRDFLNSLGISTTSIDPRNLRIYGNGGGMLPQANNKFRYDDLVENAIRVVGEEDGRFDANDYVVFYGESPHIWKYEVDQDRFAHEYHLYSDTNFYYITVGDVAGKRVEEVSISSAATYNPTTYRGLDFHEIDNANPEKSGRYWLGEAFNSIVNSRKVSFYLPDVAANGKIRLRVRVAANADRATSFRVSTPNRLVGTISIGAIQNSSVSPAYLTKTLTYTLSPADLAGDSLQIELAYNASGSSDADSWLDWIEVDYDKQLQLGQDGMTRFSLIDGIGPGEVAQIELNTSEYEIWDISNPIEAQAYPLSGNPSGFKIAADSHKDFIAFKGDYLTPSKEGGVNRQNLHGLELADYLIITYPGFRSEAERLAQFHRDYYDRIVHVVTPEQIYHEFSSGKQDVSAIRNFVKMFYDQSGGQLPGFVLFFGDGSFDYKGIFKDPTSQQPIGGNFTPTYQSRNSWSPVSSYTSDDFFVILDDHEGFWGENVRIIGDTYILDGDTRTEVNLLDAAIGRLPIGDLSQAKTIVDKIISYTTSPKGWGPWRHKLVLVADHKEGDGSIHAGQADSYTNIILNNNPCINLEKIYLDNYPAENTPSGMKFPKGKEALLSALDEGSLLINYTGHGSASAWSNSDILLPNDIQNVKNPYRLPAYVTATCSFGHYDDPEIRSGAETLLMMEDDQGSIAMFTTVRLVYSSPNATLNGNLYREIFKFDEDKGRMPTVGEVMMRTKNATFPRGSTTNINSRNFSLLGDPGLILSYPSLKASIKSINGEAVKAGVVDTLRSLSRVDITGSIEDPNGNRMGGYNGTLSVTIFDKPSKFITRLSKFPFTWQKNRIFNGTVSIVNGDFDFSFVVPIDISTDKGVGKISLYIEGGEQDGGGCYSEMYIGGTDIAVVPDSTGPEIELFINDENWIEGGITDSNPYLHALVRDPSGINTIGSAIGHEIIGILDEDEANAIILNEYYTAQKDSYSEGLVRFQIKNLADGKHKLMVRIWDGANNPSEARTSFIVASSEKMVLNEILNVPNPFSTETEFWIGHNQTSKELQASVRIYNMTGQLVKELTSNFIATGNQYKLKWDSYNDAGHPINNGMYLYQVILRDLNTGNEVSEVKRLVLVR